MKSTALSPLFCAGFKTCMLANAIQHSDTSAPKDFQLWQVLLPLALQVNRRIKREKVFHIIKANLFYIFTTKKNKFIPQLKNDLCGGCHPSRSTHFILLGLKIQINLASKSPRSDSYPWCQKDKGLRSTRIYTQDYTLLYFNPDVCGEQTRRQKGLSWMVH